MSENLESMLPDDPAFEERLWDYIDGRLHEGERTQIEQLIRSNSHWKMKYEELLSVNELLQSSELSAPSMRFTKNVMEEIGRLHIAPATKSYINNKIIWGLGIFFVTLIVGFLVYGFGQVNWKEKSDTKLPVDLSSVDYSRMFDNNFVNGFMMLNVILGLFLLDRFLSNKRKQMRSGKTNEF